MNINGIIASLLVICLCHQRTKGANMTVPPVQTSAQELQFSCENGNVANITSSEEKLMYFNGTHYCHVSNPLCKWQGENNITIVLSPDETNQTVFGGNKAIYYRLECLKLGGFQQTATAEVGFNRTDEQAITRTAPTPSTQLQLTINKKDGSSVNTAKIGEELTLKLEYSGNYQVYPIKCKAYPTTGKQPDYVLWENCKSLDIAVGLQEWTISTNNTATTTIYGFRFVESNEITIECTAMICPMDSTNTCTSQCFTTPAPTTTTTAKNDGSGQRRRRYAETQFNQTSKNRVNSATAAFTIADDSFSPNSGSATSPYIFLTMAGIWIISTLQRNS